MTDKLAGLPTEVIRSINSCPPDVKETAFRNIIVCGGLTRLNGFSDFLNDHVSRAANVKTFRESLARYSRVRQMSKHNDFEVRSQVHPSADNAVFEGCSLIQSQEFFQRRFIDRATFDEFGSAIVRRHFYSFTKRP